VRSEEAKADLEKLPGVKAARVLSCTPQLHSAQLVTRISGAQVIGDAMEAADVIGVLDGCDAAVSTLGKPYQQHPGDSGADLALRLKRGLVTAFNRAPLQGVRPVT